MSGEFETNRELDMRIADALDRLRSETALHLRKYARRVKDEGVGYIKAQFALDPNANPDEVAVEALRRASQGMFTSPSSPMQAIENAKTDANQ